MKNEVLEKDIKVRYSEMDYDLILKPSALLQFLQDMASENAEDLGFGYSYIIKNNLAWFLLKYRIEFDDYPQGIYDLKIKTEPRGYNKMFAFRDFEIKDGEKLLGRATSAWALININTKSITSPTEIFRDGFLMKPHEKRENDLDFSKVRPPQNITTEKLFEVRFDDLDVNKHANNANYIIWAFEPLDFDYRHTKKLKLLDIIYKKEITYGSKVLSQIETDGNITNHILKNAQTGDDLCLIKAEWTDK